jgi:hypothetical protein
LAASIGICGIRKKSEKWQNTAKFVKQTQMAAKFSNVVFNNSGSGKSHSDKGAHTFCRKAD